MIEDGATGTAAQETAPAVEDGDRLSLGVAARLSRYLQVLTQARKMGKETISSQELSEYTHAHSPQIRRHLPISSHALPDYPHGTSTQIRRGLAGFGAFGKGGVGYIVDSLVSQIRK